jgi:hypothetical protein
MAAYTTTQTGNWSSTSTWGGTGPPGNGDTATVSFSVTVDTNTTVGSSPNTGGTAAITINTNSRAVTLTIATGVALICKGDIIQGNNYLTQSAIVLNAGSSITLRPPSGQQYKIDCTQELNSITINGSSGSHCAIATDTSLGGTAGYISTSTGPNRDQGVLTATYCDFSYLGTSSTAGVQVHTDYPANTNVSITNCTFSHCNFYFTGGSNSSWDGNLTFQYNSFTNSTTFTPNSATASCAGWGFGSNRSSGTRLIDSCAFDKPIDNGAFRQCQFTNNVVAGIMRIAGNTSWPSDTYFNQNVFYGTSAAANLMALIVGDIKNCYFAATDATNPQYLTVDNSLASCSVTGCIFENPSAGAGQGGAGDCVLPQTRNTGTPTLTVKLCIVLPDADNKSSGKLITDLQTQKVAVTVEHNTYYAAAGEGGIIQLDEAASSYAGEIASCRANIAWASSASSHVLAVRDAGSGTPAVDAVTLAGYNGYWNPNTGTCYYNSSTSQANVTGYEGIKVSNASPYPNAQIGTGDFTANPQFVDSTRNLGSWGATQGGDGTAAGAIAILAANPALIGQAGTGLLAWVRNGFQPQSTSYKGASYSSDPQSTDANGNSWAGGATPDVGAMAVLIGGGPVYMRSMRPMAAPSQNIGWHID